MFSVYQNRRAARLRRSGRRARDWQDCRRRWYDLCSVAKFCWSAAKLSVLGAPNVAGAALVAEVLQAGARSKARDLKKCC